MSPEVAIDMAPPHTHTYECSFLIQKIKGFIMIEAALGVNRLYLLRYNKYVLWSSYVVCSAIGGGAVLISLTFKSTGVTNFILKQMYLMSYVVILTHVNLSSSNKSKLNKMLHKLSEFDEILKIENQLEVNNARMLLETYGVLVADVLVYGLLLQAAHQGRFLDVWYLGVVVVGVTFDMEQIFFMVLLKLIQRRAALLKGHVLKMYDVERRRRSQERLVELLARNCELEVDTLHRLYEALHECSAMLNSILNLPYLVMYMTTTCNVVITMSLAVHLLKKRLTSITLYLMCRCVKSVVLVLVPCYYTSQTTAQATQIKKILHDAICFQKFSKPYRRRVKTLYKLCKECRFEYSLMGVVKLNMTLPLTFISLCVTYIVIVVQFSKFID